VVLLGASNLTRSLPLVLGLARAALGPAPVEAFVAAGHGRSYGRWSRVAVRGLPGILDCDLWPALAGRGATHVLVTDVGNDLAYGVAPAELAGWIDACLGRLAGEAGRAAILTLPPAASLARLARWQYHLFKAVLFPGRRLPFAAFHARLGETEARLRAVAAAHRATIVEPPAEWYGPDAIHIRPSRRAAAWRAILASWGPPAGPGRAVRCRGLAPAWRTVAGLSLRRPQPSVTADGLTVSLF